MPCSDSVKQLSILVPSLPSSLGHIPCPLWAPVCLSFMGRLTLSSKRQSQISPPRSTLLSTIESMEVDVVRSCYSHCSLRSLSLSFCPAQIRCQGQGFQEARHPHSLAERGQPGTTHQVGSGGAGLPHRWVELAQAGVQEEVH